MQPLCVSGEPGSRHANGVQASWADMIISVLKKQAGLNSEASRELAGLTLIYVIVIFVLHLTLGFGSFLEFPTPNTIAFIGEIGLGGELRSVPRMEKRVNTVAKLGYKKCIVSKSAEKSLAGLAIEGTTIVCCRNLKEIINTVFITA
ncbi:hypothetical protein Vadar_033931 [Vaccinium darrowii]|uniref:Uncharacterized protein n=1 Tax=Vaccinium darrowii TaxID=229202 RepID=A0ACB7ZQP9_9ERIC|nr:hypothetical protein Vadar_033931 [Vaccinium darrowii]